MERTGASYQDSTYYGCLYVRPKMYSCLDRKRECDSGINVFVLFKTLLSMILNNSLNNFHNA